VAFAEPRRFGNVHECDERDVKEAKMAEAYRSPTSFADPYELPGAYLHMVADPDADTKPIMLREDLGLATLATPLIYLAGPYTARTQWERERNVQRAKEAAAEVLRSGAIPVYTHAMYHSFHGAFPESLFVKAGLELVRLCSGLWAYAGVNDSEGSVGTLNEIAEAKRLGKPCGYALSTVLRALSC